ncbi:hypothetical protein SAMN05444003_2860 [Cognatiyoonia sediminum]|uniref:Uncharacterized protein n=1 Tax=Cognatiyoonia sediminum TaxID=1508389 RepID=A0A1M5S4R8_9RHOB|nr:hypothetical protein [Cognatiyoonia sediminum]SHH33612.1 hypothetical protein SAMN05444003_2860 [Cognatiyoonia sediminum]
MAVFRLSTCAAAVLTSTLGYAEAQDTRPIFSESYSVADALAAYAEIDRRWDEAQAEQQSRFVAFEGDQADFVRSDPILQDVEWPYEECTSVVSLIPPPMPGWGISSDASYVQIPVSDENAEVTYIRFDPSLTSADREFYQTEEYVSIRVVKSVETQQFFEMMYAQEAMRSAMFDLGPFNYPMMKQTDGVVLGDVGVAVTATNPETQKAYLELIVGCAIKSGFISELVDPASLKSVP